MKKTVFVLIVLLLNLGANMYSDSQGIVVILNGPSSVGKTSIQKALQKKSQLFFLRLGIDTFFDGLIEEPDLSKFQEEKKFDQFTAAGEYIRGVSLNENEHGQAVVPLHVGPAGDRIIQGMHRAISEYAKVGNHVIVDYILYKPEWAEDLKKSLEGRKVYYVKVHAPLQVIEEREKARNTSPVGHSRSHYDTVHAGLVYDLSLDTSLQSPEQCADKILELISKETN